MRVSGTLADAVTLVDLQFGDGYAEKHPELVAAVIQVDAAKSTGEAIHL